MSSSTITPDGVRLVYEVVGQGPPLALVHGITESRRTWDPLVEPLAATHTVVALDLRGHGESSLAPSGEYDLGSMAGDVAHVLGGLGLGPAHLVGHSLGGIVVTAAAATMEVRSVVNVDQPLALAGFQEGLAPLAPLLRGSRAEFDQAIGMVFGAMAGPLPEPERVRVDALRRAEPEVVLAIWAPVLDGSAAQLDRLVAALGSQIDAPYLSLHGIDPGPGYAEWLAEMIDGAVTEVWPDHGHYPHLVDTARFLARLTAWTESP